jgi:hypothetical protein
VDATIPRLHDTKETLEDPIEARQVMRRSLVFTIHEGLLHKQSISDILQKCVTPEEGNSTSTKGLANITLGAGIWFARL